MTEEFPFCLWSGMGRCVLPRRHEGPHQLDLVEREKTFIAFIGSGGRMPSEVA